MKKNKKPTPKTVQARILGLCSHPDIHGSVSFKQLSNGVLVVAEVYGLPYGDKKCEDNVFGFHIHEGNTCKNNGDETGGHFNPKNSLHPYHAGDMPPLFGNEGYAYLSFFTNRFSVSEIVEKVVVIHESPDDFTSQPSGNSGEKIACGKIVWLN